MCYKILNYGFSFSREHPKYFELADQCFEFAGLVERNLQSEKIKQTEEFIFKIILGCNYCKATESFISLVKLIDFGLLSDAQVIARKLLEIAIHMNYITLDKEKRSQQYWHYSSVHGLKFIKDRLKGGINNKFIKKEYEQLLSVYEMGADYAKKYFDLNQEENIHSKYKIFWAGIDLRKMAEECKMEFDYENCYQLFNMEAHADVTGFANYIDFDRMETKRNFKTSTALKVLLESIRFYCILIEIIIREYEFGLFELLDNVLDTYNDLYNNPLLNDNAINPQT